MSAQPDIQRIHELFDAVSELPTRERADFLAEACGKNTALRAEVESLLAAVEGSADFLRDPSIDAAHAFTASIELKEGDTVDHYRLLEEIGEGAHATVYMVEQLKPIRRRAAMKVIKLGMDTREVIARFEMERQALAMMDHPNIAKVLDAGATDSGRPYFVMELVKGMPITKYCDLNNLATRERLDLFIAVCQALQHAHLKGVIHRDVKPSNILVTLHDGVPVPKVIDFGIAKATEARLLDRTIFTRFHQFIGTPAYMSPEQAEMSGLDVDTRSDIYSLGVLLYELLVGSTPFDGEELLKGGYGEIQRVIREEEPHSPSTRLNTLQGEGLTAVAKSRRIGPGELSNSLRGDLDWIVMKALEKDRTRRYQTAGDFARDIQRHLVDEPVEAGPPGRVYRVGKFVRRHRPMVLAGAMVAFSLVAGILVAGSAWQRAVREAEDAKRQAGKADAVTGLLDAMFQSASPGSAKGKDFTVRELLDDFSRNFAGQLDREPEVEMTVRRTVGSAYEGLGDYVQAEFHLRRAHELAREIFGEEAVETMRALARIGWLTHEMGSSELAAQHLRRAMVVQERELGVEHRDYLHTVAYLAAVELATGNTSRAENLARSALTHSPRDAEKGFDPMRLLLTRTLAGVYRARGRDEEANELFTNLVGQADTAGAEGHPHTMEAIHTMAELQIDRGELDEAEKLIEKGIESAMRVLGPKHRTTLLMQGDLARIEHERGNLEAAGDGYARVFELQRTHLGEHNQDTIRTMLAMSRLYLDQEHHDEAESLAEKALALASGAPEEGSETMIESFYELAEVLVRKQRYSDAEELLKRAHQIALRSIGHDHATTDRCLRSLANLHSAQGKWGEAEALYRGSYERCLATREENDDRTLDALRDLMRFVGKMGRYAEALELGEKWLSRRRAAFGEEDEDVLNALTELGELQRLRGIDSEAQRYLEEAYQLSMHKNGPSHHRTLTIMKGQAQVAKLRTDYSRVEAILDAAETAARSSPDEDLDTLRELQKARGDNRRAVSGLVQRAEHARQTLQKARARHGSVNAISLAAMNRLIKVLVELPDAADEADERIREYIELSQQLPGKDVLHPFWALDLRARHSHLRQRDEETEGHYRAVIEAQKGVLPLDHQRAMTTYYYWSEFLQERNRIPDADALLDHWQDEVQGTAWPADRAEVLLPRRSRWSFRKHANIPRESWQVVSRDDLPGTWFTGLAPFGHGITAPGTNPLIDGDKREYISTFFHRDLQIEDPDLFAELKLRLRRADGAVVYLNGEEVVRSNLVENISKGNGTASSGFAISRNVYYVYKLDPSLLRAGENVIAVELGQSSAYSPDMAFDLELQVLRKD